MWSIIDSSVNDRSATPVPESISTSLSSNMDVVRKCLPPIPPLHPSIRSFIASSPLAIFHRIPSRHPSFQVAKPGDSDSLDPHKAGKERIRGACAEDSEYSLPPDPIAGLYMPSRWSAKAALRLWRFSLLPIQFPQAHRW